MNRKSSFFFFTSIQLYCSGSKTNLNTGILKKYCQLGEHPGADKIDNVNFIVRKKKTRGPGITSNLKFQYKKKTKQRKNSLVCLEREGYVAKHGSI